MTPNTIRCRFVVETTTTGPCATEGCTDPEHTTTRYGYALPTGEPVALQPGDVYLSKQHEPGAAEWCWANCDGFHLYCVLPSKNEHRWCVDARASNCALPHDREHRCWVRHGDPAKPETLHVDKQGRTCNAGAGSIQADGYHGYLDKGAVRTSRSR